MAAPEKSLVIEGDPSIEVRLRRSPRTRRLSLRISQLDGRVTLSLPARLKESVALDFLNEKADWVRAHLDARPTGYSAELGATIPVFGRPTIIREGTGRGARLEADALLVSPRKPAPPQAAAVLKVLAREQLASACDKYSKRIGRDYGRLTLRDTRSRWGSCTSEGNLMFSWRLAMAPLDVLDYVAAHEVAHLVEMNHGPEFWRLVSDVCPNYKYLRQWLRDNGADLHQVRFET